MSEESNFLKLTSIEILGIVVVSFFIIAILSGIILILYKKLRDKEPIYGFAGKSLSIVVMMVLLIGLPATVIVTLQQTEIRREAEADRDIVLNISVIESNQDQFEVSFSAIPRVNGKVIQDEEYNVAWSVTGEISFEETEYKRSSNYPSFITKTLPAGDYNIKVAIKGDEFILEEYREYKLESQSAQ